MTVFAWGATRFDVGVAPMNDAHKVLVGQMNSIHDRAPPRVSARRNCWACWGKQAETTVRHFADEEACIQSIGFAEYTTHTATC